MKKTLLILLTSVSFLSISACYSTPEMDELRTRVDYENGEGGCSAQADYQHEGLRNCIESRMAFDDENKKTVTIVPTKKGTLVIPRSYDDETMMDTSRIYERVDINDDTVVIEEGYAPKKTFMTKTTTIIETSKTSEEETSKKVEKVEEKAEKEAVKEEKVIADQKKSSKDVLDKVVKEPAKDASNDAPESKKTVEKINEVEEEAVIEPEKETLDNVVASPDVILKVETKPETKGNPLVVVDGVKEEPAIVIKEVEEVPVVRGETVVETEIITSPETKVKAEIMAEPESVIEIEKKVGDVEVKKTVTVTRKEPAESESKSAEPVDQKADSDIEEVMTVVLTPSTDDVVVSLENAPKSEERVVQTTKTTTLTTEKKEKIKTFKKNEKEVLPIEEK